MAEVLVVALPHIEYLLLQVVSGRFADLTGVLVPLAPVLKLVVSAAVEGLLALAALEEGLLAADLAAWRLRARANFLSHKGNNIV